MAVASKLPRCGTCPFTVSDDNDNLWCHGAPPSGWPSGPGNYAATFPPVGKDMIGCALHPKWPKAKR